MEMQPEQQEDGWNTTQPVDDPTFTGWGPNPNDHYPLDIGSIVAA
jgi:hypothetical protein